MPRPLFQDDQRLPASYANFYIANGVVTLPTYDPERDAAAASTLQRSSLPAGRRLDCTDLVWGLGPFHCVTQQWRPPEPGIFDVPASVARRPLQAVHSHPGDMHVVRRAADDIARVCGLRIAACGSAWKRRVSPLNCARPFMSTDIGRAGDEVSSSTPPSDAKSIVPLPRHTVSLLAPGHLRSFTSTSGQGGQR